MKTRIIAIIALAFLMVGCSSKGYEITGTVNGLPDGTVLTLEPFSHSGETAVAEAAIQEGKVCFTGAVEQPLLVNLRVKDSYGAEQFMLENVKYQFSVSVDEKTNEDGSKSCMFSDFQVNGSPLSAKLETYKAAREKLNELYNAKNEKHKDFWAIYSAARAAKDEKRIAELTASDAYKQANADKKTFFDTVEQTYQDIILENKDTYWGPMMACYLYSYFTKENLELFNSFSKEAQESYYGRMMHDELPGADIGSTAGIFAVKDDNGKVLQLDDLCKGKKYVLIDFWASWCKPCRNEIPNVKKQYELYHDKGFEVISVSIDKNEAAWRKALEEEQLPWPNFLDTEGAAAAYKVSAIPAMWLIDAKDKTIIASTEFARGEELASKLADLFK